MTFALKLMYALGDMPSFYGRILPALEEAAPNIYAPIINVGAVGVCLIALAVYFKTKDARYEKRIDEAFERERAFQEKYAEIAEKYRSALEKTNATLDTVLQLLRQQSSR